MLVVTKGETVRTQLLLLTLFTANSDAAMADALQSAQSFTVHVPSRVRITQAKSQVGVKFTIESTVDMWVQADGICQSDSLTPPAPFGKWGRVLPSDQPQTVVLKNSFIQSGTLVLTFVPLD